MSSGTIFSIDLVTNLEDLRIQNNSISGHVDDEYSALTSLSDYFFHTNQLSGTGPTDLVQLSTIKYLNLFNNKFSGTLPDLTDRSDNKYDKILYIMLSK